MILTKEQQAILDGEKGETLAKVMKTLVMYGDAFEAEKLVPITSKYNHLVTSFGLKVMSPVYDLMQQLLDAGVCSDQKFSVDPRPIDKNGLIWALGLLGVVASLARRISDRFESDMALHSHIQQHYIFQAFDW